MNTMKVCWIKHTNPNAGAAIESKSSEDAARQYFDTHTDRQNVVIICVKNGDNEPTEWMACNDGERTYVRSNQFNILAAKADREIQNIFDYLLADNKAPIMSTVVKWPDSEAANCIISFMIPADQEAAVSEMMDPFFTKIRKEVVEPFLTDQLNKLNASKIH